MKPEHFPLRHISIRVPWHDSGWNGSVCQSPAHNTSCLKLKNIFESKDERIESQYAGQFINEIPLEHYPPCVKERATFMADFPITRMHAHPYASDWSETHTHFKPTALFYPAYGAAALPFRWMMKKLVAGDPQLGTDGLIDHFPLQDVDLANEPDLGFPTSWMQDHRNHRALLDCFWKHVRVEESLVFFYAKQIPLVDDTGQRIIVGVGRVQKIGPLTEYDYHTPPGDGLRSLLWERMVSHSIRPGFADGFLMPYHEALEKSDEGRAFDPAEVVAFAPEDRFLEFSYATEHVGHDAAISSLLSCRAALLKAKELFSLSTKEQEQWIDRELGRLWKKRGAFPGLGAALCAMGIPLGNFVAHTLVERVGENGDLWAEWDLAVQQPASYLPPELAQNIDGTIARSWKLMSATRRAFLHLLSRIDLTVDQATLLANSEDRKEHDINLTDEEFLENPYLIYESTRLTGFPFAVAIGTVDRGLFPTQFVRDQFPIPQPSLVQTAVDLRRLRALAIRELEEAALRGDTLLSRDQIVASLRSGEERKNAQKEERTNVTGDLMLVAEEEFAGEIQVTVMGDGSPAYQLCRFVATGEVIRKLMKRVDGKRHDIHVDWRAELEGHLGQLPQGVEEQVKEERAREEKAAALSEIAASRFSVLIGPAGTGKTTLLSVLCKRPEINSGQILLLAPTGKARVRMESVAKQANTANYKAYTLAQYLSGSKRYRSDTQRYVLTGELGLKGAETVIVDECSMLTEEMMAALLESLGGVQRLIFVGDSRQLPPIGAGRPFVDVIAQLKNDDFEDSFPRVGKGIAELTVPRRQGAGEREDLQLAAWFGGGSSAPGEDEVFEILAGRRLSEHIRFLPWETPEELESLLGPVLEETLQFDLELDEAQAFAQSFGGFIGKDGSAWFSSQFGNRPGNGEKAEAWQILSPVRQKPWGVDPINRAIHLRYMSQTVEKARHPKGAPKIPKPMADSQIVYGDKVINNRNWAVPKPRIYPQPATRGYLANGEIGMVVGHRWTQKRSWKPDAMEIEFSTQTGQVFKFYPSDFSEEGTASLELAYALTVHKAQGSEFNIVFLILPRSPLMLTRELLYTALTRQKDKIVVLHQGSATDLHKLSSEQYSATATRLTNLFRAPNRVKIGESFLEERLIHNTTRGESVRSKSEVIIANLLHAHNIDYHYEHPLEIDGVVKYPDFVIEDDDSGITYYWEHCGMLGDAAYRRRWENKLAWYRENGILPLEENGGPKGTLIITRDTPQGGISSQELENIVKTTLLN